MKYSFIDFGREDFLREDDGEVIMIIVDSVEAAENWLLENGEQYGWTNKGVRYWNWDEEQ